MRTTTAKIEFLNGKIILNVERSLEEKEIDIAYDIHDMFVIGMKPALSYFKIVQVSVGNFLIIYFLNMLPLSSQSCLC